MRSNQFILRIDKLLVSIAVAIMLFTLLGSCDTADDDNPLPITDVRDKFLGSWNVSEDCAKGNYVASIAKDPSNSAQVLLYNFADAKSAEPDTAIVAAGKAFLYRQTNSEGWLISGTGTYQDDGTISWEFDLEISGYEESCIAIYTAAKKMKY